MSDVYENCPAFENDKFLLRFSQLDDAEDLVSVYSDKNALPFFNSDNCHGDNFYYPNEDRMRQAIKFWLSSYSSKWFVRWTIIDKEKHEAIGTIEVFHRSANDNFNHVGVLRLDLKSEYETSEEIFTIMNLIVPPTFDLFECEEIITKVPVYAVERIEAMKRVGFKRFLRKDCRHQIQQHKHIRFLPRPFRCPFSPDPLPQHSQHHKSPQHQRSIPEKQIFCISDHYQLVLHIQR